MSQVFNLARFLRLLRAHWAESWKTYAWFFGVCAIINGICLVLALQVNDRHQYFAMWQVSQEGWYGYGLVITGLVFATRYFESFSGTGSSLIQLMRPASAFEKWCLALLFVGILFPLVYTALYACMNYPAIAYAQAHYVKLPSQSTVMEAEPIFRLYLPFTSLHSTVKDFDADGNVAMNELVFAFQFLAWLALCLGGRVFFKRAAVLKTWLLAFGLLLLAVCIGLLANVWFLVASMTWMTAEQSGARFNLWDMALIWALVFGVPILLWIGLLFHIKEREVA